jgi:hypothetical protein
MKKIFTIISLVLFTVIAYAQRTDKITTGDLQIKNFKLGGVQDSLLMINSKGNVRYLSKSSFLSGLNLLKSLVGGENIGIDNSDPENPIINLSANVSTTNSSQIISGFKQFSVRPYFQDGIQVEPFIDFSDNVLNTDVLKSQNNGRMSYLGNGYFTFVPGSLVSGIEARGNLDFNQLTGERVFTFPDSPGEVSLSVSDIQKRITGTGDKIVLENTSGSSEQSIQFNSLSRDFYIVNDQFGTPPLADASLFIREGASNNIIQFGSSQISFYKQLVTNEQVILNGGISVDGYSDVGVIFKINTSTPQTSTTLNNAFPGAVIGVKVINQDSTQRYTYTKVGSTTWRRSELMTDI